MVAAVIAGIIGALAGLFIPKAADAVCAYKYRQKDRAYAPDTRFTASWLLLLYVILGAAGPAALAYFQVGTPLLLLGSLLWLMAILLAQVDLLIHMIPNEALLLMAAAGAAIQLLLGGWPALRSAAICLVAVIAVFSIVAKMIGFWKIGAGDVKLGGVMGISLGYPAIMSGMLAMAISMLVFCLGGLLLKKLKKDSMLPMAPFLSFGFLVGLVYLLLF